MATPGSKNPPLSCYVYLDLVHSKSVTEHRHMANQLDILPATKLTVDDYLPFSEFSLDNAVAALPENLQENFSTAWRWFMDMSGTKGTRMLGQRIPGVSDDFPISAQRGIHVPSKSGIALSVTVARGSIYSATDKPLIELPNGTWILEYSAHRNNTGGETDSRWNNALMNCLRQGFPVGVFMGEGNSRYTRYLALVEEYHPDRGVFTLHGPITRTTESLFSGDTTILRPSTALDYVSDEQAQRYTVQELEEDKRKYANYARAIRVGQNKFRDQLLRAYDGRCACTDCGVTETLQAAHIVSYRGQRSNVTTNGLLLRADIHLLFDNSLITIEPDTLKMVTSRRLADTDYEAIDGRRIRIPRRTDLRPNEVYLAAHYEKFQQIECAS